MQIEIEQTSLGYQVVFKLLGKKYRLERSGRRADAEIDKNSLMDSFDKVGLSIDTPEEA